MFANVFLHTLNQNLKNKLGLHFMYLQKGNFLF